MHFRSHPDLLFLDLTPPLDAADVPGFLIHFYLSFSAFFWFSSHLPGCSFSFSSADASSAPEMWCLIPGPVSPESALPLLCSGWKTHVSPSFVCLSFLLNFTLKYPATSWPQLPDAPGHLPLVLSQTEVLSSPMPLPFLATSHRPEAHAWKRHGVLLSLHSHSLSPKLASFLPPFTFPLAHLSFPHPPLGLVRRLDIWFPHSMPLSHWLLQDVPKTQS